MHELTSNQEVVLEVLRKTIFSLAQEDDAGIKKAKKSGGKKMGLAATASVTAKQSSERGEIVDTLQRAYDRERNSRRIMGLAATPASLPTESTAKALYMPRDRTIAVFQAAMDEYLDIKAREAAQNAESKGKKGAKSAKAKPKMMAATPEALADLDKTVFFDKSGKPKGLAGLEQFDKIDPGWASVLLEIARRAFRGKAKFISHTSASDFRLKLINKSTITIALVSDWGGGNDAAEEVGAQIKKRQPDYVIHLGDVYYAGTEFEIKRRFLNLWDFGPATASGSGRSFALNSNHEMYGGGHGYFKTTLKALNQEASYFSLANTHWRFIGLDTGYVDHDLNPQQTQWLGGQLTGTAKTVLLSHHQPFSAFADDDPGAKLRARVQPFLNAGKIYGWFWGHEHLAVAYGPHENIKGRCIGHGCIPYDLPGQPSQAVPVEWVNRRTQQNGRGMHGFALLTLNGANMRVEYIDQDGTIAHTEDF